MSTVDAILVALVLLRLVVLAVIQEYSSAVLVH